jgi:sialate O-acetylesterase
MRFHSRAYVLGLMLLAMIRTPAALCELQLAALFGDHMMLQRNGRAAVWGTADPNTKVTLTLVAASGDSRALATAMTTAGADGKWLATFKGLKAGGPFELHVVDGSDETTVYDVLVGDIWICSGQSNMEYKLRDEDEIASPADPMFRYILIPKAASLDPQDEIGAAAHWVSAAPDTRATFTAIGYYFGKRLRQESGVPIGLIHTSWGGTAAELWMPKDALDQIPQFGPKADNLISAVRTLDADAARFATDFAAWEKEYGPIDPGASPEAKDWASPDLDISDWKKLPMAGDWTSLSIPNGGVVWVRKTIPIPPELAGMDLHLNLDSIHDFDTTYFNGEEVGHGGDVAPYFWGNGRAYVIPGRLVKAGNNTLAIRVVSQGAKNGTFGWSNRFNSHIDAKTIPDGWLAKVEVAFPPRDPQALGAEPKPPTAKRDGTPTVLWNAMVHPLIPYGIKGVIWYQGENNVKRGYNYRTIFPKLIESWRAAWGDGEFPFYFVQLANLGHPPTDPNDPPGWAELRESQLVTWETVPHTGMTVTVDIGDPNNIHPADKRDVGERLARFALNNDYHLKMEDSGPVYQSMTIQGDKVRLHFTHSGTGLMAKDGEPLHMFAIAGADQKFSWADAVIDGDDVVVSAKDVPNPIAVRYAWFSDPEGLNLYNKDDLPATPFRTDNWPTPTMDVWW